MCYSDGLEEAKGKETGMTKNTKQTSDPMASKAGATLRDPNASAIQKSLAASASSQADGSKQTGAAMEGVAAKALASDKYSDTTKSLAGTVVSQANKKR